MTTRRKNPNPITTVSAAAGEIVGSIEDIVIEILRRAPVKTLIRLKLVCKIWLSLITSRQFCLLRLRNPAPNPSRGLFLGFRCANQSLRYKSYKYNSVPLYPNSYDDDHSSINLSFNFTICGSKTLILNYCNGLLLCSSSNTWNGATSSVLAEDDCELYIYNPSTKCYAILPHLDLALDQSLRGATIAFDPFISPHYKVVLVMIVNMMSYHERFQVQIYSSETGVWSYGGELHGPLRSFRIKDVGGGVYWKGSVHWLRLDFSPEDSGPSLRYNVETQAFHEMPTPPVLRKHNSDFTEYYFGESSDHLHFIERLLPRFNVYEMKTDYSEWFVKYQVDLVLPLASYPEVITVRNHQAYYFGYAVSLIREDDENSILVLQIPGKLLKYNLVDGTLEKLVDLDQQVLVTTVFVGARKDGTDEVSFRFDGEHVSAYIQSLCNV